MCCWVSECYMEWHDGWRHRLSKVSSQRWRSVCLSVRLCLSFSLIPPLLSFFLISFTLSYTIYLIFRLPSFLPSLYSLFFSSFLLLIHPFIRSSVHSSIHSFVRSFIHSFIHCLSFCHMYAYTFLTNRSDFYSILSVSLGIAKRNCSANEVWYYPDYTDCKTNPFTQLKKKVRLFDSLVLKTPRTPLSLDLSISQYFDECTKSGAHHPYISHTKSERQPMPKLSYF